MNDPMTMQFNRFMQQMRGIDPTAVLNQLLSTGKITQQQINEAHKQAKSFESQLEGIRKNFGL